MARDIQITLVDNVCRVPTPISGIELYGLAKRDTTEWMLPTGVERYYLWRIGHGKNADECIIDSPDQIDLKPGDKFYWAKTSRNP